MAAEKPRRRRTRAQNMEIIKRVTMDFLKEKGYMGISVNKIAEASGINISQIYRYFPNGKPDILIALGNDISQDGAPDPDLPEHRDPRTLLSNIIRFYIGVHRRNKAVLSSMQAVFLSHPEVFNRDAETISTGGSDFSAIETVVERYGIRDESRKRILARQIFHLIDTMIHRQIMEAKVTSNDEDLARLLTNVVQAYLQSLE